MRIISSQTVLKLFQQETVYQRCYWKKPVLAEAQLSDLPEKVFTWSPRAGWASKRLLKDTPPPLFFSRKSCKHIMNGLSMVACLAAENSLERSLIHNAAFSCSSSAFPPIHTTVSQGCLRHLHLQQAAQRSVEVFFFFFGLQSSCSKQAQKPFVSYRIT